MGDLQCTLEFSVELQKFINVDLFQRGFYQLRTTLKVSPKLPAKIEVSLPKNSMSQHSSFSRIRAQYLTTEVLSPYFRKQLKDFDDRCGFEPFKDLFPELELLMFKIYLKVLQHNNSCTLVFPACIVNGTAVSKTFQILYKNEEILLDDFIIFKVHVLVEGHKVQETLYKGDFQMIVELWFTDQTFGPDQHNSIHCVSTRTLLLHFDPCRGLHHHLPLLFDYFHLCAVTVTIHASILAVCQPYLSIQKPSKQNFLTSSPRLSYKKCHSSMETVLFGPQVGRAVPHSSRLYRARLVHWELCFLLLSAYNSLCRKLIEYTHLLPPWQQLKLESLESSTHLNNLSDFAKECYKHLKTTPLIPPSKEQLFGLYENMDSEEDILVKANSDIAQMCGALILIWQQFHEIVVNREKIRQHLSRQRHFQRVKRFSEAFFIIERTRDSALAPCDSSVEAYQEVSEGLRRSSYLNLLPPLEVECVELDGDFNSLPIVYEEHFQETARRGSNNSRSSQSESTVSLCDVNFLVEESLDEKPVRRNSQGSLGQKSRSPDISATPTSPSAFSWCPEALISSPVSIRPSPLSSKKTNLKDKLLNNFKMEFESDCEEYGASSGNGTMSRVNHKLTVRSKIKLRSKTVNFLRQLKKPHFSQVPSSVVLLGVKKLDSSRTIACGVAKASRIPFAIENGIRHSQSTLSVMSTLCTEGKSLSNSESMPDLTTGFIPPPPPPPRSRFASSELDWAALDLSVQNSGKTLPSPSYNPPERKGSFDRNPKIVSSATHHAKQAVGDVDLNSITKTNEQNMSVPCHTTEENWSSLVECTKESRINSKADEIKKDEHAVLATKLKHESEQLKSQSIVLSQPAKFEEQSIFNNPKNNDKKNRPLLPSAGAEPSLKPTSSSVSISSICEICPPSPPVQFRDPPKKTGSKVTNVKAAESSVKSHLKKSSIKPNTKGNTTTWSNDSCLTSLICQGTLFFPKPPAEFAGDDYVSDESNTYSDLKDKVTEKNSKESANTSNVSNENLRTTLESIENLEDTVLENKSKEKSVNFYETKCTIMEMLTDFSDGDDCYLPSLTNGSTGETERARSSSLVTANSSVDEDTPSVRRASVIGTEMISFVKAKEEFRKQIRYPWLWYSDFPSLASSVPYFQCDSDLRAFSPEGMHLVICVHGLDGNSADLRLVRTYLELGLPTINFEFLMSERNQGETFDDFDTLTDRLVSEITYYIEVYGLKPAKISFIGHSLGNIIIRSALTRSEMKPYMNKLHTFLSLSGPHLGTLYNSSGLVNMGMWFMQKWKKSGSLLQLAMKDASDLRQTFLYKLSKSSGLEHFHNILLFGSSQDRYVPLHSARIEMCKPALKDTSLQGVIYREMVTNLIQPIIQRPDIALLRYDVHHALPSSANSLIGRAAHIAVLDSELFIEKFLAVCGLRFFT